MSIEFILVYFIFKSFFCFILVLSFLFYSLELFFMIYDEIIRIFKLKRSSKIKKFDIFEMLVYDEQEEMIENKKVKDVNNELYDENLENFNNKLGEKYFFRLLILNILLAIMLFFTSMSNLALQVAYGGVV